MFITYEKKRRDGRTTVWGYGKTKKSALADAQRWISCMPAVERPVRDSLVMALCDDAVVTWIGEYGGEAVPLRFSRGEARIRAGKRPLRSLLSVSA